MRDRRAFVGTQAAYESVAKSLDELLAELPAPLVTSDSHRTLLATLEGTTSQVVMAVNDAKIVRTSDLKRVTESRKAFWKLTLSRGGQVFTTVING